MKNIYLRVEHRKANDEILLCEYHSAVMNKEYVCFDNYKVKISDTEEFDEQDKNLHDRATRCIKVYAKSKRNDPRFIRVN